MRHLKRDFQLISEFTITVSETALETFDAVRDQIFHRFGSKAMKDFERNTQKVLAAIAKSPFIYKQTEFDINVRRALIKKRTSVFYQIKVNSIEILFFWDNRQDPIDKA